ncbi:MAG TPA: Gfo/Idh/MocA family oxidoreductase [Thermoanaerobaculia bacterium]|nr:Gfo/Idh/MocA family oxidoreductase [Thermoanaerobaculia bacterium]
MARIGIIGTGWGARVQAPALRRAGLEVVAIAGRDPAKTAAIAAELDLEPYASGEELIARAEVDLISIVSPPKTHRPYAIRALERGRHVLCEKPTALNAREAEQMLSAAERRPDRLALIDHELRFLPSWLEAKRRIGELGPIRWAEVRYSSPSRNDPNRPWNWWSDLAQGGGVWGAVGSHYVDALRYFAGEIDAVQAVLHTFIRRRPLPEGGVREVTADDFAAVHLRLASGGLSPMTFTAVSAVDEDSGLTIVGEKGAFRLVQDRLLHAQVRGEWSELVAGAGSEFTGDSPGGAFGTATIRLGEALRNFLDEGDREALAPAATFLDGLRQQQVLDAARASHRNGGAWEPAAR